MYKKLKFIIAGVAIVAGLASAVSCQDLSKDVESLGNRLTTLENTVKTLEGKINGGAVITNVASSATGVTVTLSDGKTFTISNGAKGDKGDKGDKGETGPAGSGTPGTVVTIGANGNWFLDGVDTGLKAAGQDGKPGKDGESIYWVVSEDGKKFVEFKDGVATGKEVVIPAAAGTITAVWDEKTGSVTFYGVEGLEDGYVIGGDGSLKSLVFVPEVYIDGVEGFTFKNFQFKPKSLKNPESSTEYQTEADKVKNINPATLVSYHVNPANADLSFLKEGKSDGLKFIVVDKKYIQDRTKAPSSADFGAVAKFKKFEKGVLTVEVEISGTPATAETISMLALEVTTPSGATVTSDYATTMKEDLDKLAIALPNAMIKDPSVINLDPAAKDAHYRRASKGISVVDDKAYIADKVAWTVGEIKPEDAQKSCDLSVKYDASIDLKKYVAAHKVDVATGADKSPAELTANELAGLGLTWDFAVVKNYKIGKKGSETDQINFVDLKDGVFTPKVYETTGEAAIGRTPIVRVALKNGNDVVEYAYIKVYISNKEKSSDFDAKYVFDESFAFNCKDGALELSTNVKYMNVNIYNVLKLSKEEFHAMYDTFVPDYDDKTTKNVGKVEDIKNAEVEGTHIIKWTLTKDEAWENAGKTIQHVVAYKSSKNDNVIAVILLEAKVDPFPKVFNVPVADYNPIMWKGVPEKNITYYNVFTPDEGETDSGKCVFLTDINISFKTWTKGDVDKDGKQLGTLGVLKLTEDKNGVVTQINYFFCKTDVEKITMIGDVPVKFTVEGADKTELWAAITIGDKTVKEKIAVIDNTAKTLSTNDLIAPNSIELLNNDVSKVLVNTNMLKTYIGAEGYACGDSNKKVKITFIDGKDHFQANFVRPIDINTLAADYFVDALDFGEPHTFIRLEDLVAPIDWRGRSFEKPYENYWKYYGIEKIELTNDNILWDAYGTKTVVDEGIVVKPDYTTKEMGTGANKKTSQYGFLTYRNGNVHAMSFNFYVKAKVTYKWGVVYSDEIVVNVKETIGDTN